VVGNRGGAVLPPVILLLPGVWLRPAACSCLPSTWLIVLCAAPYAGGRGGEHRLLKVVEVVQVMCRVLVMSCHQAVCYQSRVPSTCAVNVCTVKAGSGSCFQGGCHPGGSDKVWTWRQGLEAAARSRGGGTVLLPAIYLLPDTGSRLLPSISLLPGIHPILIVLCAALYAGGLGGWAPFCQRWWRWCK
jgi:hypothetical protein